MEFVAAHRHETSSTVEGFCNYIMRFLEKITFRHLRNTTYLSTTALPGMGILLEVDTAWLQERGLLAPAPGAPDVTKTGSLVQKPESIVIATSAFSTAILDRFNSSGSEGLRSYDLANA